jgi:hypothetical protein
MSNWPKLERKRRKNRESIHIRHRGILGNSKGHDAWKVVLRILADDQTGRVLDWASN